MALPGLDNKVTNVGTETRTAATAEQTYQATGDEVDDVKQSSQ